MLAGVHGDLRGAGNLAGAVVDLPRLDSDAAIRGDQPGLAVVEHVGAKVQAPLADQLAALLEQRTDRRLQHASGGDTALVAVAHLVGYKLQAAFTHQAALFGVVQAGHADTGITLAADGSRTVVQDLRLDGQSVGRQDLPLETVVQCLGDAQGQSFAADQPPALIVQCVGGEGESTVAGYLSADAVVHHAELAQQERARR